jgi:uncharacterized repeat protein (TIGR02543 family)
VNAGAQIGTLPSPNRSGYTFDGWNSLANGTGTQLTTTTVINANATYYAQWTLIPDNTDPDNPGGGVTTDSENPPAITPSTDPANPGYYIPGGGGYAAIKATDSIRAAVKTVYAKKGETVKIPFIAYASAGNKGKKVNLVWTSSNPKLASVKLGKSIGIVKGKLDDRSVLKVKTAKKTGTATLQLKVDNKVKLTIKINVGKKYKKSNTANNTKATSSSKTAKTKTLVLKKGDSKFINIGRTAKTSKSLPKYTIAKKYKKFIAVDAVGKVTAKKAYKKGKKTIPVKVKVGKKTKIVKVQVG